MYALLLFLSVAAAIGTRSGRAPSRQARFLLMAMSVVVVVMLQLRRVIL